MFYAVEAYEISHTFEKRGVGLNDIVLEVNLLKYREYRYDYIAEWLGEKIIVDPYVGCVWSDEYIKLGKVTFEGFWGSDKSFLPYKEICGEEKVEKE